MAVLLVLIVTGVAEAVVEVVVEVVWAFIRVLWEVATL